MQYPVTYYTTDLDLRLVGNPVTFSVTPALIPGSAPVPAPSDGKAWPQNPQCGAIYTDIPPTAQTPVYVSVGRMAPGNSGGAAPVSVEVGVRATRAPAAVTFGAPLDVSATAPLEDSPTARQIVAHGRMSSRSSPARS